MGWRVFGFRLGLRSLKDSGKCFDKYWKEPDHIRECLPYEKACIDIIITGKFFSRYNFWKRHGTTWDFKERGDTGYIIHRTDGLLYSSKESLWVPGFEL